MTPFFAITGSYKYVQMITQHLADMQYAPEGIQRSILAGNVTVSLQGCAMQDIAMDTSHEMGVNRCSKANLRQINANKIIEDSGYAHCTEKCFFSPLGR